MDLQPVQQPISDDQELAKALAGVTEIADESAAAGTGTTPAMGLPPLAMPVPPMPAPTDPVAVVPDTNQLSTVSSVEPVVSDGSLDSVKKEAIGELRPLVDKLNVSAEEKFDTYLLLIRSTDDKSLIAPAHEAAKAITDEAKRADALLNIIKEIDFLSNPQK